MGGLLALVKRLQATHAGRAYAHYNAERGPVLAGGLAYVAVFSVFSILFAGFTVLALFIGHHPDLQRQVISAVNGSLPGVIDTTVKQNDTSAPLKQADLFGGTLLSWTGIVAFVLALISGLGWIDALREGVRAMFGVPKDALGPIAQRVRDFVGLVTFGLAVLVSAALSVVVTAIAGWLLGLVGMEGSVAGRVLLRVASVLVVFVVDAGIFIVLLRVLARLPIPRRDLRQAALVGAAAIGLLKLFAGVLLRHAGGSNPLLATAGVLVGVLVWMNLVARVVLVTAAWAAVDPAVVAALTARHGERIIGPQVGPAAVAAATAALRPWAVPDHGERAADRVTIAAGAVLGASAVLGTRLIAGAATSVLDAVRRR